MVMVAKVTIRFVDQAAWGNYKHLGTGDPRT